jgi:hypothetical protein
MVDKELLKKLGEETVYSAKGHFKACDIRRNLVTITIWSCAILNVAGIIGIGGKWDKSFSIVGFFGTIALLIWNEGDGKDYKSKHKKTGEDYLALHKEARRLFLTDNVTDSEVTDLNNKVINLDSSEKLDIPFIARKWAQKAIQRYDETNNWFL